MTIMQLCIRKCHPKRLLVSAMWSAIAFLIIHQLSIIDVSILLRRPDFVKKNPINTKPNIRRKDHLSQWRQVNFNDAVDTPRSKMVEENVVFSRGHFRSRKGYLTVGLCTVPRSGAFYLPKTLASLTANLTETEKLNTVFVIYLGSYEEEWINSVLKLIDTNYSQSVEDGMIQVIQPKPNIYPDFSNITRRTFGDSTERIIWRTKQNVDYAYLFSHSREISRYYIHIEDDVIAAPNYLRKIQQFVNSQDDLKDLWFCLEFSRLGFIGKLVHSSDLPKMKEFFLLFQFEKPGDLLLNDLKTIMTQHRDIYSIRSLFKHMGQKSSLANKTHSIKESRSLFKGPHRSEGLYSRIFNPPAKVLTSLLPYQRHKPEDSYNIVSHRFFWTDGVKEGDTFEIILEEKGRLKAVTVRTGHPIKHFDKLKSALLRTGTELNEAGKCVTDNMLGSLHDGYFSYMAFTSIEVRCIVLYVNKAQKGRVIINKIILAF